MFPVPPMAEISLAMRWGIFKEGRFLGKVLDEWIGDGQEFVHVRLPRLIVIALIALDRKSTRLNSSHYSRSRMPSSA